MSLKLETEVALTGTLGAKSTRRNRGKPARRISWLLRNPFASGYLHYATVRRARLSVCSKHYQLVAAATCLVPLVGTWLADPIT